jgi:hypothetical protein
MREEKVLTIKEKINLFSNFNKNKNIIFLNGKHYGKTS